MILVFVTRTNRRPLTAFLKGSGRPLRHTLVPLSYDWAAGARRMPTATFVFADLERLSTGRLGWAAALDQGLRAQGLRVLNAPSMALSRYGLLRALFTRGMNDFVAYRACAPGAGERRDEDLGRPITFPVFVRREDDHRGSLTPLLHTEGDLRAALEGLRARGPGIERHIVIEFCGEPDADRRYRKYGAWIIGDRIVPDHVDVGPSWQVKGRDRIVDEDTLAAEWEFVRTNPHREQLQRVAEVAGLQYGRIDYGLVGGRPQIYEINTNPKISEAGSLAETDLRCFVASRLVEAFRAIDEPRDWRVRFMAPHVPADHVGENA